MFSSNQIFTVSGALDATAIKDSLDFALRLSGNMNVFDKGEQKRGCKLLWQISKQGKYCIGWGYQAVPEGWSEFQFSPDTYIISLIIQQHLSTQVVDRGMWDGSYKKGFLMSAIPES